MQSQLVGPIGKGLCVFTLTAPGPDLLKIPEDDLIGTTVLLLKCFFSGKQFLAIGFYVEVAYDNDDYIEYLRSIAHSEDAYEVVNTDSESEDMPQGEEEYDDDAMDIDSESEHSSSEEQEQEKKKEEEEPKKTVVELTPMSPQKFFQEKFNPNLLKRTITKDENGDLYMQTRQFEMNWNNPWNIALKEVYKMECSEGKPPFIDFKKWLNMLVLKEVYKMECSEGNPPFINFKKWSESEELCADKCWQFMLDNDPGIANPYRSFDWLDDIDLPNQEDIGNMSRRQRRK